MIKSVEATGKTTEEAFRKALLELAVSEDEASMEVLTLPKSGFLGLGAVPARVRVSCQVPDLPSHEETAKAVSRPAEKKAKADSSPGKAKAPARKESPSYAPGSGEEQTYQFLHGLLEHMDVRCDIIITPRDNGGLSVKLDGANMGAVIGRRGETLDAIQHLVNYVVNRGGETHMHISVDAEDYRSKREESLVRLAEKMAAKTLKYKRSMALEPMNSYERHVIHTALQNYEGVSTSSTGTEPNRRVVVAYDRDKR